MRWLAAISSRSWGRLRQVRTQRRVTRQVLWGLKARGLVPQMLSVWDFRNWAATEWEKQGQKELLDSVMKVPRAEHESEMRKRRPLLPHKYWGNTETLTVVSTSFQAHICVLCTDGDARPGWRIVSPKLGLRCVDTRDSTYKPPPPRSERVIFLQHVPLHYKVLQPMVAGDFSGRCVALKARVLSHANRTGYKAHDPSGQQ